MASTAPLKGSELIDCAKANSSVEVEVAANRCGYGDVASFEAALREAGDHIGVHINSFSDLSDSPAERQDLGVIVAPDSPGAL